MGGLWPKAPREQQGAGPACLREVRVVWDSAAVPQSLSFWLRLAQYRVGRGVFAHLCPRRPLCKRQQRWADILEVAVEGVFTRVISTVIKREQRRGGF